MRAEGLGADSLESGDARFTLGEADKERGDLLRSNRTAFRGEPCRDAGGGRDDSEPASRPARHRCGRKSPEWLASVASFCSWRQAQPCTPI